MAFENSDYITCNLMDPLLVLSYLDVGFYWLAQRHQVWLPQNIRQCDGCWLTRSVYIRPFRHSIMQTNVCNYSKTREGAALCLCGRFYFDMYVGCAESVRTLKIARHCVDLAGRSKCYSLVMSLTNCVAKTALLYLA
jgi:hypothetical protein